MQVTVVRHQSIPILLTHTPSMNPAAWPVEWATDTALHPQRMAVQVVHDGHASTPRMWSLQRRCALTPQQFAAAYGVLAGVSLVVAAFFWLQGVRMVGAFAGLELLALGVAFVLHAVHGADGETLCLQGRQLRVERRSGLRSSTLHFDLEVVRVSAATDGAIELRVGRAVEPVGRQAGAAQCSRVLHELRHELMQARAAARADE